MKVYEPVVCVCLYLYHSSYAPAKNQFFLKNQFTQQQLIRKPQYNILVICRDSLSSLTGLVALSQSQLLVPSGVDKERSVELLVMHRK